jgi:hypothetical protein
VLSTRRCSLCEDGAPSSFRRGKTRSASDMAFHGNGRLPRRRRLRRCARGGTGTKCGPRLLTRSRATDWRPTRVETRELSVQRRMFAVVLRPVGRLRAPPVPA